jgi:glycosyltransferase involved in cell wall biosynthesis
MYLIRRQNKIVNVETDLSKKKLENITVDIVVTSFNSERYLDECLYSIVKQDFKNWKIILVDDGSKDKSIDTIRSFIKRHKIAKKCKLLSINPNCGYGMSLKTGIEGGEGDIVFIVDSDDALAVENAVSLMVEYHQRNPNVALYYSNYYECDSELNNRALKKCRNPHHNETYLGKFQGNKYLGSSLIISHLKSFKRVFYDKTEGLNSSLLKAVDKDLILKLEEVGELKHIAEGLYLHRKHDKSISMGFKSLPSYKKTAIMDMKMSMYFSARDRRTRGNG